MYKSKEKIHYKGSYKIYHDTTITQHPNMDEQSNILLLYSPVNKDLYISLQYKELAEIWTNFIQQNIRILKISENKNQITKHMSPDITEYDNQSLKSNKKVFALYKNQILESYATKKGHFRGNWKARFFHLENGILTYFKGIILCTH